jgi:electron transfer flavoprotein alpha subunit
LIVVFSLDRDGFRSASFIAQSIGRDLVGISTEVSNYVPQLRLIGGEEEAVEALSSMRPQLVVSGGSRKDLGVAARVAARLRASFSSNVLAAKLQGQRLEVERPAYGGKVKASVSLELPAVICVSGNDSSPDTFPVQVNREHLPVRSKIRVLERRVRDSTDLRSAKVIVSVGRGIGGKEGVELASQLAQVLGGALAGSRAVTAELGWLPPDRQIGISGQRVKPDVYLALGISGQPQHVFGMRESKVVVAVNKDRNAPIAEEADYLVVADALTFASELLRALKNELRR